MHRTSHKSRSKRRSTSTLNSDRFFMEPQPSSPAQQPQAQRPQGSQEESRLTKKEQIHLKKQEKEQRRVDTSRSARRTKMIVAGVLALVVIGGIVLLAKYGGGDAAGNTFVDPGIGPENASVVVTSYEDFQCPACAAAAPVVKDILEEYGDKIRYEYNDFPLPQHQYGTSAAIAGECAFEQGKFFELHDILYDRQEAWSTLGSAGAVEQQLRTYAAEVGVDTAAFESCVARQDIADRVNEDIAEARSLRVNSTPSFFVNGKRVVGAPFSTTLRNAITDALQ